MLRYPLLINQHRTLNLLPATGLDILPTFIKRFFLPEVKTEVIEAERAPKSNKLLKLQVDLSGEQRQVGGDIGKEYALKMS